MPVIIDTNCLANVFSKSSSRHPEFKPILDWIVQGKGMLVYGGSTYFKELRKTTKYLRILRLFKEQNKVIIGDKDAIDELEKKNKEIFPDKDFDDPHLPAIAFNTKCMIICSEDIRSIKYIKDSRLYPQGFSVPVFYTGKRNSDLLCDKYVHYCNKPLIKINNETKNALNVDIDKSLKKK